MTRCRPIHGGGGETVATDSFKFWDSYRDALKRCTPEQGYRLIMALCGAVFDGEAADFSDEPLLGMVYDVMLEQSIQSRDLSRKMRDRGKKAAGVPKPNARKTKAKQSLSTAKQRPSEKRREEVKGTETSSLREEGAAYAGAGSRPPATPAPDPWDDPDYDGPIPYLGPDDSDGTDWA